MNAFLIALYIFLLADLIDRIVTYFGLRLGYKEGNILVGNDKLSWPKTYLIIIIIIEITFIIYLINDVMAIWYLGALVGGKMMAIRGWFLTISNHIMREIEKSKEQGELRNETP